MPFEAGTIARARDAELVRGAVLRTCSATDLVVHKAFAARPQDWVDFEGVLVRQKGALAWAQLWADLGELAVRKEAPELLDELERVARRAEAVVDHSRAPGNAHRLTAWTARPHPDVAGGSAMGQEARRDSPHPHDTEAHDHQYITSLRACGLQGRSLCTGSHGEEYGGVSALGRRRTPTIAWTG